MNTTCCRILSVSFMVLIMAAALACGKGRERSSPGLTTQGGPDMAVKNSVTIKKDGFGTLPDGAPVDIYTLTGKSGFEVRIMTYGATLVSVKTPDRNGKVADITLGFDDLAGYLGVHPYFGAIVGRYGNRIAGGMFKLNGVEYKLAANDGKHHLHGGLKGFDKVLWKAEPFEKVDAAGARLSYLSKDGEEGYPGDLAVTVTYTLNAAGELWIDYEAETDKETPVNLTNHTYWNLAGPGAGNVLGTELQIESDRVTEVDATLIPNGKLPEVKGTPFDFTTPHTIGERIGQVMGGYDHNFVLRNGAGVMGLAATAFEPGSGRTLAVLTDQPGVQFYTGNFLDGTIRGKGGVPIGKNYGFCLETQHYPDSPNHPDFPSTILEPGRKYRTTTVLRFGVK